VVTLPGMLAGIIAAVVFQDVQIAHLWVDWAAAIPQLQGPYIPAWYDQHRALHALSWSLTGLVTGAGITWLVRDVSSRILGQEAMGLGDVTLMGLIGSVLGWQAVLLTFALAPLTGVVIALAGKLTANRPYLPYGPCLAAAAVLVLLTWREMWAATRLFFSDVVGVTLVAVAAFAALALLLGLVRLYRSIPTGRGVQG
jgi:leader peptidase (prepilin peptidase)/N-methyltransferase